MLPGNQTLDQKEEPMADQPNEYRQVTREELDELAGEALPERAAMSLINANIAIPINAAIAATSCRTTRSRMPTRPRTRRFHNPPDTPLFDD